MRTKIESVNLYGWQKDVISEINAHAEKRDGEQYQGISDYSINRSLGIVIAMPRYSGHTFLTNYIAAKYPSVLVYRKMDDFQDIIKSFPLHAETDTMSTFEIFYAIHKPDLRQPSPESMEIRERFKSKKVVVVDGGLSIPDDVRNLLYEISQGIVVLLGH